jgi:hypothetical protein
VAVPGIACVFSTKCGHHCFGEAFLAVIDTLPPADSFEHGFKMGVLFPLGRIDVLLWVDANVTLDFGEDMIHGDFHVALDSLLPAHHPFEDVPAAEVQQID